MIYEILCQLELEDDVLDQSLSQHEANMADSQQRDINNSYISQGYHRTGSDLIGNRSLLFQVDNDFNLTKDHYQLPDIDKLTEMLYPANEGLKNYFSSQYFHSFKATCNQFIFTAHFLQFSVRNILENQKVLPIMTIIRKVMCCIVVYKIGIQKFF